MELGSGQAGVMEVVRLPGLLPSSPSCPTVTAQSGQELSLQ